VAYIPNGKVIGMSKFHEIVNMFSKRFQIQERLTNQIANSISKVLQTDDIAVNIKCKHSCMFMRGIEKDNQFIHTSVMSGKFREVDSIRQELFYMLK
jgi:GTP cyclohydrolase I